MDEKPTCGAQQPDPCSKGFSTTGVVNAALASIAGGMQLTFELAGGLMILAKYLVRSRPAPTG
ncbi:MAG: hypothetical protein P1V13_17855 [Rhizobiaceae bacterium]|nr:hypothetical protein [Rhizobiaceae bacterium]